MQLSRSRVGAAVGFLAIAGALVSVSAQMPPMPKPGPEHELFKMDVGTWDAVVEMSEPGAKPATAKGVEVNTIGCGGLCLISDFKGELMPGVQFHGHGMATWDPVKKVYAGSWTDSMSQGVAVTEGSWDPAGKKFTGTMEGRDTTGRLVKSRSVSEYRPDGTRVLTMYVPGPDGKEVQIMRISYTRRQ